MSATSSQVQGGVEHVAREEEYRKKREVSREWDLVRGGGMSRVGAIVECGGSSVGHPEALSLLREKFWSGDLWAFVQKPEHFLANSHSHALGV